MQGAVASWLPREAGPWDAHSQPEKATELQLEGRAPLRGRRRRRVAGEPLSGVAGAEPASLLFRTRASFPPVFPPQVTADKAAQRQVSPPTPAIRCTRKESEPSTPAAQTPKALGGVGAGATIHSKTENFLELACLFLFFLHIKGLLDKN